MHHWSFPPNPHSKEKLRFTILFVLSVMTWWTLHATVCRSCHWCITRIWWTPITPTLLWLSGNIFCVLTVWWCVFILCLCRLPRREAGDVWCLPPVWNLRAVIWFHFAVSSLVLLPSPVTLSILSFSACWSFLWAFPRKFFSVFRKEIGFFVWLLLSS